MIKHIWSVFCRSASIDNQTNQVSLFNIIENISVMTALDNLDLPMHFSLVSLWGIDGEEKCRGEMRAYYRYPEGNLSRSTELEIELDEAKSFQRTRIDSQGIRLTKPGIYHFIVELQQGDEAWVQVADLPFHVVYTSPQISPERIIAEEKSEYSAEEQE